MSGVNNSVRTVSDSSAATETFPHRFAIVNYVESKDQIYGVYSIHNQILKLDINAKHVVLARRDIDKSLKDVLLLWVGEENCRFIDSISAKVGNKSGMWQGVFNKLAAFNLTEFEKVIVLDADILIRSDITHWFDYPTPCAIQGNDDLNWNSGAMVITPDSTKFQQMLGYLPDMKRFDAKKDYDSDPMTNGYSDQEFVTAFFTAAQKNVTGVKKHKRCVMPTEAAVLSSWLRKPAISYFNNFHPWIYETIHFTVDKPWRRNNHPDHPFVCKMLFEWNETMKGLRSTMIFCRL